jgi:glutathione S-transferase
MGPTQEPGLESYSPFCLKVHRALKLAGLLYTSRQGTMPRDFRHLNPAGQVPVLLHGDEPVFDSTRILVRVAELAPGALDAGGAEAWLWEDWADRALSGYTVAARWADRRNWAAVRDVFFRGAPWFVRRFVAPAIRKRVEASLVARDFLKAGHDALWDDYRRVLDHLETRAPRRGFWFGDRASLADIAIFAQLRQMRSPLTPWQSHEIAVRPNLDDWLDRIDAATRAPSSARLAAAA